MSTPDAPATGAVPGSTPFLNAALAAAESEMPPIAKGETGKISGTDKYGKPFSYEYSYADLSGLTAVAYPIFGKHGLSFSAQPTLTDDGKFILRYQLRHESGESLAGVIPLPSAAKPQDLGTVLTYYRRYAFCAVTGIHPGGDDDDASSANHTQQYDRPQSAADAFESAAPAPRRAPAQAVPVTVPPLAADDPWADKVAGITDRHEGEAAYLEVNGMLEAGTIDLPRAQRLRAVITARVTSLKIAQANGAAAPAGDIPPESVWQTPAPGRQPAAAPARIRQEDQGAPPPSSPPAAADGAREAAEAEFIRDFMARLAAVPALDGILPMQRETGQAVQRKTITPEAGTELASACRKRANELEVASRSAV